MNDKIAQLTSENARLRADLAQVSEVLKDYITQAKARDNGLSVSDLQPIFARYHRGEISEGLLIEEIRFAALATVEKLTSQAVKERDEARAALRGAMQYVDWSGVPVCEMDECLERWREIAGTDTANKDLSGPR